VSAVVAMRRPAVAGKHGTLWADHPRLPRSPWACVNALRSQGHADLGTLAMPTLRDEAWRFTDLTPLGKLDLQAAHRAETVSAADMAGFQIDEAATRLVFVDGVHSPELSGPAVSASGVLVANLAAALTAQAAAVEAHLGRHQPFGSDVFASFNTAFLRDAAVILVSRNATLAAPIHLLFISTQAGVVTHPRCLLIAEAGSSLTLIEDHVSLQGAAYLSNAVCEIVLAEQAQLQHIRVQRDGAQAFHIANTAVALGRVSQYRSVSVDMGAQLSRHHLDVVLGEGADCAVDGLAVVAGSQLADTHSCIVHAQPHGRSRQLHKCIAGGTARAVFTGKVGVRPGAQHTDAAQMSRNLLLSARARIDTQPQLEILADDVKCAHGATVGSLDSEEVFYLQSRGLSDSAARELLTYAFGAEIIARIPIPSLRQRLQQGMRAQTGSRA
jgi:Fe-S cluster assembly protein SufD